MTAFAVEHPYGRRARGWYAMTGHTHRGRGRKHRGYRGPGMRSFFGPGPRARRGDIRSAILALLSEGPMHGYQIMNELAERTGGVWRPSPGSVYPTLQQLQDEGLVREVESDGGRHTFELTQEGRETAQGLASPAPWEAVADESEAAALEVRDLVMQVMAAARQVVHTGEATHLAQAKDVLRETRQRLYRILAEDAPTSD